jgi:hypothetical protein
MGMIKDFSFSTWFAALSKLRQMVLLSLIWSKIAGLIGISGVNKVIFSYKKNVLVQGKGVNIVSFSQFIS